MMAGRDPRDWDLTVKQIQSALNTIHNKSIDTAPLTALIGCEARGVAESSLLTEIQDVTPQLELGELRKDIKARSDLKQREQKERYDRARREAIKYQEDDLVLIRITSDPATGTSKKLHPKFKDPFRVKKVLVNDRYEVEDLREGSRRGRSVAAADNMKGWITIQGN